MYHSVEAIVLRLVRHSDKHSIVRLYTPVLGSIACVTPAGEGREARRRRALMAPLAAVRCVVSVTPGRDLHHLRDVQPVDMTAAAILADPVKGALAQFLADLLDSVLREPQPDELLYEFVAQTSRELAAITRGASNYHLLAMVRLTRFLGIEPDWGSFLPGRWLDEVEGAFRSTPPMHDHYLNPQQSRWLNLLRRLEPWQISRLKLSGAQRNYIIDRIIGYYRLHEINTGRLQSLDILRRIF